MGWLILFILKGWLVGVAVSKMQKKLKDQYHLDLTIKSYKLNGWSEVVVQGVECRNAQRDTVAYFNMAQINIKLWPLVRGKLRLEKMWADEGFIDITLLKHLRHHAKTIEEPKDSTKFAKAKKYLGLVKDFADMVPDNFLVKKIRISYQDSIGQVGGYIDSLSYADTRLNIKVDLTINRQRQSWSINGNFEKSSLQTHLNVTSDVTGFYELAMIKELAKAQFGFRTFVVDIERLEDNADDIYVRGDVKAEKVLVYNPRLSTDTISMPSGGVDFSIRLTESRLILDSTSRLHLNDLTAMISSDYTYSYPGSIHARLELAPVPAQNIINAMPQGAFEMARTITLDGRMGYHLDFYLNIDEKDSIKIDASVINEGLKIINTGRADLRKLNGSFTYHPYNSRRPILVDSTNSSFTPMRRIPRQLIDAVVSSEDPNFFSHHGIEPDAIEASFLKNMQNGSFRQGGSTISMQLVKNVFLTHKKTIDRKLEEFFLVWLLENMHIASKNRMLEVYLNIIEWGPDVYGIGEASQFYFNKRPGELTLNESIFLAKIIPQPLGFMHRFDEKGNLKENFQLKVLNTVDRLSRHGKIDEEQTGSYWPEVRITGRARNLIKIVPSNDSLRVKDSISRANDW
jgi:hypothetical protein